MASYISAPINTIKKWVFYGPQKKFVYNLEEGSAQDRELLSLKGNFLRSTYE
jgi:hypothetical protein